jgi:prolyl-tRNA editing enzyme YbaK/EbsC (Cys-tRNA(Pro) deacylase)
MSNALSASALRVQQTLQALGFVLQVVELPQSTRTSIEAAQACGCQVAQIAKSLVFQGKRSSKPVLVIASGANRVDEKKLAALIGEPIQRPDADFVREKTGFAIGGVAPVGLSTPLDVFIDEDILQYEMIWAAAGTPHAVFQLTPADLCKMTGGRVVTIKREE